MMSSESILIVYYGRSRTIIKKQPEMLQYEDREWKLLSLQLLEHTRHFESSIHYYTNTVLQHNLHSLHKEEHKDFHLWTKMLAFHLRLLCFFQWLPQQRRLIFLIVRRELSPTLSEKNSPMLSTKNASNLPDPPRFVVHMK